MVRAGLVVMVVVSVALLLMVMTADGLHVWPFPIGRGRNRRYVSGALAGLSTGGVASRLPVAVSRRGLFGPTVPVHGPEDLAARLAGRTRSDVQGAHGRSQTCGGRRVRITSAEPSQPLEVVVRSSPAADDGEEGL